MESFLDGCLIVNYRLGGNIVDVAATTYQQAILAVVQPFHAPDASALVEAWKAAYAHSPALLDSHFLVRIIPFVLRVGEI